MRLAVVGVGALGGYVGGWLAHTGEDVTLIPPKPENIGDHPQCVLELDGVTPEEKVTVKNAKTMHLTEMEALSRQKPIDIAFVSTKLYDNRTGDGADQAVPGAGRLRRAACRTA